MEKLKSIDKNCLKCPKSSGLCIVLIIPKSWLNHLDVPVTELLPEEIVKLRYSDSKLIFLHIVSNLNNKVIHL